VTRNIVIAVDATERSVDPLALGKLLADATRAPAVLVSVFPYDPLADPHGNELPRVREEAREILFELGEERRVDVADAHVVASNLAARELQSITERDTTGVIVVGSTSRGPVGRLLPGGVGERLLAGSACPVAIAPRGYAEHPAASLRTIGVAFDGSEESRHAMDAGRDLARLSGADVRVITVFEHSPFGATATLRTGGASINELMRRDLHGALDELLAGAPADLAVEGRFLEGPPGKVLAEQSAELELLATGSRGYGPRAAVLLGTTTHKLMRTARCPGLVMPRGLSLDLVHNSTG
jgi:nucleotide-binding universal stress UspA family protein